MHRINQIEELIAQILAQRIQEELAENFGIISVKRVFVARDIRNADVYISAINCENEEVVLKQLNDNRSIYQKEINDKSDLRYTPKLTFKIDKSSLQVDRVEELLQDLDRGKHRR